MGFTNQIFKWIGDVANDLGEGKANQMFMGVAGGAKGASTGMAQAGAIKGGGGGSPPPPGGGGNGGGDQVDKSGEEGGLNVGHRQGLADGKRIGHSEGRDEGYNTALKHMQKWVDRSKGLEKVFAEGGLSRLWNNKIVFSSGDATFPKSSLKDRRTVFLQMLAYAEYYQSNVDDIWRIMNKVSNQLSELASNIQSGKSSPKESSDALLMMAEQTMNKSKSLFKMQKDEMVQEWIVYRLKQLEGNVKYATVNGIIPNRDSIPRNLSIVSEGYEIAHDKFDIVTDARKYLGETRSNLKSIGY